MAETPITLKRIAEVAGVSAMTVSRTLRGGRDVNAATRKAVMQVAKKLGYVPDARLAEMMSHIRRLNRPRFSGTLAILRGCEHAGSQVPHYITNELQIQGAHKRAEALGYKIDEFILPFDRSQDKQLLRILRARGIRGLIIYPPPTPGSSLSFDLSTFSVVVYGTNLRQPDVNRVVPNMKHATELVLSKTAALGYRRLGLALYSITDTNTDHAFQPQFLLHQQLNGLSSFAPVLIYDDLESEGKNLFKNWFERHKPDLVIGNDDLCLRWLRKMGYRVPKDVGYVSMSITPEDKVPMAGIVDNPSETGAALVDSVVSLVLNGETGVPRVARDSYVHATWTDGPTLRSKGP